jgi:O-antigen ligase
MWIALVTTCIATLFLYDRRKAFIFLLSFIIVATVFIASNNILKQRALSIATSIYTEDENGSTSIRIALWKGGLLIFKASPLLGTGLGDFERDIEKLVIEKKLKSPVISHAHNIYLQVLATRGIIGLAILLSLFTCLIRWGMNRIRDQRGIGGHIIILTTILIMVGGLTDNHIELPRFLAAYCFTIGLIGPSCLIKETFSAA